MVEFAFPGPLRDQLVAPVLAGTKTSITGLLAECESTEEPQPHPGDQAPVIDSDGTAVGVIRAIAIQATRPADVDIQPTIDEGEGFTDIAGQRTAHESCWRSAPWPAELGPGVAVDVDTAVGLQKPVLVERR